MVLPRVKKSIESDKTFSGALIFPCDKNGKKAMSLLKLFLPNSEILSATDSNIHLCRADFKNKGEYKISVTEKDITIDYCDYEGIRNAISTISGLDDNGVIKCVEISDYPDNDFRSCLLDLARGYVEIDELKEHLLRLARLKFNFVHFHLMDRQSYALKSDVVPNPDNHRQYTKEELRELVDFCHLLSLEVIPEIEFPAHAVNLIKALPQLSCDIIDMNIANRNVTNAENPRKEFFIDTEKLISRWAVCIGKESTYKIYEAIIDEIIEIFDSNYIHIGGDELSFWDLAAFPNWHNCHACKGLMKKYDSDEIALYHHGIRRINEIIKSKGKATVKWNESSECTHLIDLPKDIIFEFWNAPENAPTFSDIERLTEMGFKVINAQHQYTYADAHHYMTAEKLQHWSPVERSEQKASVLGAEMCAWELGNDEYSFYAYTLPVCMALFSDRIWNNNTTKYDKKYTKAIFEAVIGKNNLKTNPLSLFTEIIPPRKKDISEALDISAFDVLELSKAVNELKETDSEKLYGKKALANFIAYLEKIKCCFFKIGD